MKENLFDNYEVCVISKAEYDNFRAINEPKIFPNRFDFEMKRVLTSEEEIAQVKLSKAMESCYELRVGFFYKQSLIGWSYGQQVSSDTFRMVTSGIIKEHQCKGIYTAFLSVLANHLSNLGFQVIFSRHYATDNAVIIPKLKFGFLISGFELTEEFGTLIRLSYFSMK